MLEMNCLIAAGSVENSLRAGTKVDRRHVALVVAVVTWIASVHHVEISCATGRRERERGRAFFVEALEGGRLRPASTQDFSAIADLILVDVAVETVAVHVLPIRIDRRRRRRIA